LLAVATAPSPSPLPELPLALLDDSPDVIDLVLEERAEAALLGRVAGVLDTISALELLERKPAPAEKPDTVRKRKLRAELKRKQLRLSAQGTVPVTRYFAPAAMSAGAAGVAAAAAARGSDVEEEDEFEEDEKFEVEAVLDHREANGTTEFLIKWMRYVDAENTWEVHEDLVLDGHGAAIGAYQVRVGMALLDVGAGGTGKSAGVPVDAARQLGGRGGDVEDDSGSDDDSDVESDDEDDEFVLNCHDELASVSSCLFANSEILACQTTTYFDAARRGQANDTSTVL